MPWTPAERERILAIAELLAQAPTANHVILSAFDWQPVGGSQLESDLNDVESGSGGPWGSAPLERARLHAQFWLVLGTVDVHSTGVLLRADVDQLPAPWPNARAALEKFAGACWLLDPALTVRQRAARAAAIEVEDRRQTRNAAAYAVGADPGAHDSPEADAYDEFVHTELPALFHSVTTGGGVTVEGERLPGYTDLVEGFVDRHLLGGRGREGVLGAVKSHAPVCHSDSRAHRDRRRRSTPTREPSAASVTWRG